MSHRSLRNEKICVHEVGGTIVLEFPDIWEAERYGCALLRQEEGRFCFIFEDYVDEGSPKFEATKKIIMEYGYANW